MATTGCPTPRGTITGHPAHDKRHVFSLVPDDVQPFTCDGCGLIGTAGSFRYRCGDQHCDFKLLHRCCAEKPETVDDHQQFPGETFRFHSKHPDKENVRRCDGCAKEVRGFVYHCPKNGADLHPCCALCWKGSCRCSNPIAVGRSIPDPKYRSGTNRTGARVAPA